MNEERKAEIIFTKIPDLCRVCLSDGSDSENELYGIDDIYVRPGRVSKEVNTFRDMLAIFVNDELETHGGLLPSCICAKCADRAQRAFHFIEECQAADKLLEKHFEQATVSTRDTSEGYIVESYEEDKYASSDEDSDTLSTSGHKPDHLGEIKEPDSVAKGKGKRFNCDKCDKSYSQSQTLRRHYRVHDATGREKKSCEICQRSFLRCDDLTRHMRTHTGERPYKCEKCGKGFKQRSELTEHSFTHSHQKHFRCTECDKQYCSRNGLYVHQKVHRGVKPHRCPHCDKSFFTTSERNSHTRHIHRERIKKRGDTEIGMGNKINK